MEPKNVKDTYLNRKKIYIHTHIQLHKLSQPQLFIYIHTYNDILLKHLPMHANE